MVVGEDVGVGDGGRWWPWGVVLVAGNWMRVATLLSPAVGHMFVSEWESVSCSLLSELTYRVAWLVFELIMGA